MAAPGGGDATGASGPGERGSLGATVVVGAADDDAPAGLGIVGGDDAPDGTGAGVVVLSPAVADPPDRRSIAGGDDAPLTCTLLA